MPGHLCRTLKVLLTIFQKWLEPQSKGNQQGSTKDASASLVEAEAMARLRTGSPQCSHVSSGKYGNCDQR
jgi:hypothetical protein